MGRRDLRRGSIRRRSDLLRGATPMVALGVHYADNLLRPCWGLVIVGIAGYSYSAKLEQNFPIAYEELSKYCRQPLRHRIMLTKVYNGSILAGYSYSAKLEQNFPIAYEELSKYCRQPLRHRIMLTKVYNGSILALLCLNHSQQSDWSLFPFLVWWRSKSHTI
jgi:outer membrane translocation and assembly module TamA